MNLELVLFFAMLSGTALAEEMSPFLQQFPKEMINKCLGETSLKLSNVNGFMEPEEIVDENVLCWAKCMNENLGMISEDGFLNLQAIVKQPGYKALSAEKRKIMMDCLGKGRRVKTCSDVKPIRKCYRDVLL